MSPLVLLVLAPFVAKEAGLAWSFEGRITRETGRYRLVGKELRGEIAFFNANLSAQKLYESDTSRTKDADAARRFTHVQKPATLAGMPAIESDQRYLWNDVPVASRCLYCADGGRAWVVRLWWSPSSKGDKEAEAFLKGIRKLGGATVPLEMTPFTRSPSR